MLRNAVRVYLDTADWSAIEDRSFGPRVAQLEALGRSGRVAYLVSAEHLLENAARDGRANQRARFTLFAGFPGTHILGFNGQMVRNRSLDDLRRACSGASQFRATDWREWGTAPLAPGDERVFESRYIWYEKIRRWMLRFLAHAHSYSLGKSDVFGVDRSKEARDVLRVMIGRVSAEEMARKHGQPVTWSLRYVLPPFVRVFRAATDIHRIAKSPDWVKDRFWSLVVSGLTRRERADEAFMRAVLDVWEDPVRRASVVGPLAAAAAVLSGPSRDPGTSFDVSDEVDALHACWLFFSDVFTCDKRNAEPLRRVAAAASAPIAIVTNNHREELLEAIHQALARVASPAAEPLSRAE